MDGPSSLTRALAPFRSPRLARSRTLGGIAAVALTASYLLTWDLWGERSLPPNLPIVGALGSLDFGVPLVGAPLLAIFLPRAGAATHGALLVLAVLGDQVRLQPEFVSLAILLFAGAWPPRSTAICRWHLIALWGWAGVHKILSAGWPSGGALFIADAAGDVRLRPVVAVLVPLCEVGLAALALTPRTWPLLRIVGPAFHIGILLTLVRIGWNSAVWPWNLALAAGAILLFRAPPEVDRPGERSDRRSLVVTGAAVLFVLYPLGFYAGFSDAYLSHNLYSSNTAEASLCRPQPAAGCTSSPFSTWAALNVPLPPERRLFIAWFDKICQPGQTLRIDGAWTRLSERGVDQLECPRSI